MLPAAARSALPGDTSATGSSIAYYWSAEHPTGGVRTRLLAEISSGIIAKIAKGKESLFNPHLTFDMFDINSSLPIATILMQSVANFCLTI